MRFEKMQRICRSACRLSQQREIASRFGASVILPRLLGIPICSVLSRESLRNFYPTFSGLSPEDVVFVALAPQSSATCRQAYREASGDQVTNGGVMWT